MSRARCAAPWCAWFGIVQASTLCPRANQRAFRHAHNDQFWGTAFLDSIDVICLPLTDAIERDKLVRRPQPMVLGNANKYIQQGYLFYAFNLCGLHNHYCFGFSLFVFSESHKKLRR